MLSLDAIADCVVVITPGCLSVLPHGLCCLMDMFRRRRAWSRYVALGDSLTAGRGDFAADGRPVGWASRLGGILAAHTGVACSVTNLAVDGATVTNVLDRQLPLVEDLRPDLVSATVGMNDIRDIAFDPTDFEAGLSKLLDGLAGTGATILTCTLPDVASVVELPPEYVEIARQRLAAASDIIREQAARRDAICLDTWAMRDVATSPELFTHDRLHPNSAGHRLLAARFADLLMAA